MSDQFRRRVNILECVYCGAIATTDEHFPPKSMTHYGFLLSACHECNTIAGTAYAFDFGLRAKYVQKKLFRRYGKTAYSSAWESTEGDTEEGLLTRKYVQAIRRKRKHLRSRLEWDALAFLATLCDIETLLGI